MTAAEITVTGTVQGVGYRWFCHRQATTLNLTGWVKNLSDGSVRLHVEGERTSIESLVPILRTGPASAEVDQVSIQWLNYSGKHHSFEITR